MNTHIDSHIAHTVFCGLLATVLGLFFSFGFSIEKAHAGYAADYQGLPWYCAELDDGLLANVTCQEAGVSNSLGSPAPRQCEASDVDSDSGSNCARLDGDGFNIYGVLSVHEVDTPQNGVTQYLRGTSESDRHGIMFVGPTLRTVGSDTTSNLKGHHIDEEYVSVTGGRDQWAWVWYTQNEYTPPDWLEDMGRQCKNWGCWRRPYELFSYVYDNQLLDKNSNEFYKRRWQDHDEGVSIEDDWDMSVFSIADTYVQGANNTADAVLQVAPNQEVEIDWMCQDEQTSQFGDQRGLFGLWDQRGYHKVKFFDAANTTNLGGTTEKSGVFRLTPTEDTVYTIQCKSSADEVEYDVYIEGKRTCSPTGECTSRRLNREVTHTYPEKLGEVLSVFVDVIDPDDPDDPAIVTSISADPTEITLGIGDQTATITWQTDWVYAATVSGPGIDTVTCSGTACNGVHSAATEEFTTPGVYEYTLEYTTYDSSGTPTVTTETATVTVDGQLDPMATLQVAKASDGVYGSEVTIAEGEDVFLSWSSADGSTCGGSGTNGGSFSTGGQSNGTLETAVAVTEPSIPGGNFTVNCNLGPNNDSASVRVNVVGELTLDADKTLVRRGDSVELTWNLAGYDPADCSLTGEGLNINPLTGTVGTEADPYIMTVQGQSTYRLQCNDGVNSSEDSVTIRVSATIFES